MSRKRAALSILFVLATGSLVGAVARASRITPTPAARVQAFLAPVLPQVASTTTASTTNGQRTVYRWDRSITDWFPSYKWVRHRIETTGVALYAGLDPDDPDGPVVFIFQTVEVPEQYEHCLDDYRYIDHGEIRISSPLLGTCVYPTARVAGADVAFVPRAAFVNPLGVNVAAFAWEDPDRNVSLYNLLNVTLFPQG